MENPAQRALLEHIDVLVLCRPGSKRNDFIPEHPLIKKVPCSLDMLRTLPAQKKSYEQKAQTKEKGGSPEKRTEHYYKERPCVKCVRTASEILEEYIKENK